MRRWRVGTLSLGVMMIVLGVVMLAAQFKQVTIIDSLLTWWPLILVFIGGEILMNVYTSKEQEPRVKYDGFSIFIIMIIVFFSIGMYALTSTGVIEGIAWMVKSTNIQAEVPSQRVELDEGVKRIVVSAPRGRLDIRKSSAKDVVAFGQAVVDAADSEEAKSLVEQNMALTRREGDTLFIQFALSTWPGEFKPYIREIRHTLLLPSGVDVEIGGPDYFILDIDGEAIGENWLIKGSGNTNITVAKGSDLDIYAQVNSPEQLGGSASWEVEEKAGLHANGEPVYQGHVKWGEGSRKLSLIIDSGEVLVNEI